MHEHRGLYHQWKVSGAVSQIKDVFRQNCYPRLAWAATGIVVHWSVCLTSEPAHLIAIALRLQHG